MIASHGPYAKGQTFGAGCARQWERLTAEHPEVTQGSSTKYTAWELLDSEHWVPQG